MHKQSISALDYLSLGEKYLRAAHELSAGIVRNKNRSAVLTKTKLSLAQVDNRTRWSDTNLGVPLLFNFFHGIELTLKGQMVCAGQDKVKGHKLTVLLSQWVANSENTALRKLINQWLLPKSNSPLFHFLTDNDVTIDEWYESLKYPEVNNQKPISHFKLKYGGQGSISFWLKLKTDSTEIRRLSVAIYINAKNAQHVAAIHNIPAHF